MIYIDEDLSNADWIKMKWELPKYKSDEFMKILEESGMTLSQFKKLPIYKKTKGNQK
jgi:hypothetical protein